MKSISVLAAIVTIGLLQQAGPRGGMTVDQLRQLAQPIGAEPIEVLDLEKAWAGVEPLMQLATSKDVDKRVREAAVRALGRLEDPRIIPQLHTLPSEAASPGAKADAIAQSLQGFDPSQDPEIVRQAVIKMVVAGSATIVNEETLGQVLLMAQPLSRIRYPTSSEVIAAEILLRRIMTFTSGDPRRQGAYVAAARSFESLARINQRVTPLQEESVERLKKVVARSGTNDTNDARLLAFMALNSGRSLDADTMREALADDYWQLRRAAAAVVAAAGGGLDDAARLTALSALLDDKAPQVRYEAVRGFARRGVTSLGCGPLEGMTRDPDQHVVLAAFDALGDACKADEDLTLRIAAEAGVPPTVGSWHRQT